MLADVALRRCTRSGHQFFAFEVSKVFDTGIFGGKQAGTDFKEACREGHLLLALFVVGGGTAL